MQFKVFNNYIFLEATISCLRAVCGDNDFQTIIEHREKIADDIEKFLEKELNKW